MDFESDRNDLIEIVDFMGKLLNELVELVPEHRAQYRRVWDTSIAGKIKKLSNDLSKIKKGSDAWQMLIRAGLTGEPLRLKHDEIESAASKGFLPKVLGYMESVWGSLTAAFPYLEAVKEFTEFIGHSFRHASEPARFQTLFGGKPIPYTDAKPSESDTKPQ